MSVDSGRGVQALGPALLDYEGLSDWLHDSVRHLRRLVDEDRIPYLKVGHYVRFDPVEISRWLLENRHGFRREEWA